MAQILKELKEQRDIIIEDYYKEVLRADKYMNRDFEAALKLQRIWRMVKVRRVFSKKKLVKINPGEQLRLFRDILEATWLISGSKKSNF